jgi:hypothetical protein
MTDRDDTENPPAGVFPSGREQEPEDRVDPEDVLDRLEGLDVCQWSSTADEPHGAAHLGPAAEDFSEAFEVGTDADRIAAGDPDGVAMAAIQGLSTRVADQREVIERQDERIAAQAERMDEQREDIESLRSTVEALVSGIAALRAELLEGE